MTDQFRGMRGNLLPLLLLMLAALPVMAYASPPDPSWISGLYDDGDFDDVVVLVTTGTAIAVLALLAALRPLPTPGAWIPRRTGGPTRAWAPALLRPRAPPSL